MNISIKLRSDNQRIIPKENKMVAIINDLKQQTREMIGKEHRLNILTTCIIQFGLYCSYYSVVFWLPELFNRFKNFEINNPGQKASVCDISKEQNLTSILFSTKIQGTCQEEIQTEVFLHTLIIGVACIPFCAIMPWCVKKIGAKLFLALGLVVSGSVVMLLYIVENSTENLIVSCLFEACISCCVGVVFTILVDLFPTNLRVMAGCLSSMFGRFGGLLGNLMFGFMIDQHCFSLICILAGMLLGAAIFAMFLPETGKKELH